MDFADSQIIRYSRQIRLKEIGVKGQKKLAAGSVLVIGAGGLGSPAAMYLAAAGVGRIGIADGDAVDLSNLQRQILHSEADLNKAKVLSAEETLKGINSGITVQTYEEMVTSDNILSLISDYDIVLDCTDSFAMKFMINDACVIGNKPFVHAGITGFEGQLMTVLPRETTCYRCVFEQPPVPGTVPTCSEAGVIGAVAGVIGTLQALEAIKFFTGAGKLLTGKMLTFDGLEMKFRGVPFPNRRCDCPVCSDQATIRTLETYEEACELK